MKISPEDHCTAATSSASVTTATLRGTYILTFGNASCVTDDRSGQEGLSDVSRLIRYSVFTGAGIETQCLKYVSKAGATHRKIVHSQERKEEQEGNTQILCRSTIVHTSIVSIDDRSPAQRDVASPASYRFVFEICTHSQPDTRIRREDRSTL